MCSLNISSTTTMASEPALAGPLPSASRVSVPHAAH